MFGPRPELEHWLNQSEPAWQPDLDEDVESEWQLADSWLPGMDGGNLMAVTDDTAGIVPDNYEPRYPYPLVIWLCDKDCSPAAALEHIAHLSPQNYVGLAIDGGSLQPLNPSGDAREALMKLVTSLAEIENRVIAAVRSFRQNVHVHSERIFLVGVGQAASTAMLMQLHQPDWFSGCVAFGGQFLPSASLLIQRRGLSGKRFWLGAPINTRSTGIVNDTQHAARQLIASAADVTTQLYPTNKLVSRTMLRDVDRWIISSILTEA